MESSTPVIIFRNTLCPHKTYVIMYFERDLEVW